MNKERERKKERKGDDFVFQREKENWMRRKKKSQSSPCL